ncbi:arylmalonate decarboxylase [Gordonia terrae]|uniref:Arylmalonate decarboxylase n=2 Tax=Gordonia terrae TaxID=2055 RepID=A0A2I1RBL5_9ACTN|nr:arylmalonate decarboxylase [Gordonia terrae]
MIVPPAADEVPPEAETLYPNGVQFIARGLGISGVSVDGFDEALDRLPSAVLSLRSQDVDAISLMGTSISFYKGHDGHRQLLDRLRELAGTTPVTTMAGAIIDGLRSVDAKRLVVGAAYTDDLLDRLVTFLAEAGFEVVGSGGLDLSDVDRVLNTDTDTLVEFGVRLIESAPPCDALLVSCGGLRTLKMTEVLEDRFGIPVVSSAVAGCHDAVSVARSVTR